jgi:hypothetical protein
MSGFFSASTPSGRRKGTPGSHRPLKTAFETNSAIIFSFFGASLLHSHRTLRQAFTFLQTPGTPVTVLNHPLAAPLSPPNLVSNHNSVAQMPHNVAFMQHRDRP